jgi:AraC-like DNA-binding protein
MNVHSCDTRSTSIAFSYAKLAQSKNACLRSRAKIRLGISKEGAAVLLLQRLTALAMTKMPPKDQFQKTPSGHRAEPVEIWKARKFIEQHSGDELSLSKVAKAVNISANHLSEKFKQVTGLNFVDYVARARFETACDLLLNSNRRISEIAFAAGFQSLSQFNRVFKKLSGKSPTDYRVAQLRHSCVAENGAEIARALDQRDGRNAPTNVASATKTSYKRNRRRRSAFPITETELKLIAAPAIIGLSKIPKKG